MQHYRIFRSHLQLMAALCQSRCSFVTCAKLRIKFYKLNFISSTSNLYKRDVAEIQRARLSMLVYKHLRISKKNFQNGNVIFFLSNKTMSIDVKPLVG